MKQYTIRPVEAADHERITSIYNHYIVNTIISFEEEIVSVEQMRRRIERVQTGYPYLVAEAEGIVVGYAYATHFRERHAYRFSTETTVYVDPQAIAAGCGTALYGELIADLKIRGFKMAIGGGSHCPTTPACDCTRSLDSRRSLTSATWDASSTSGSTSVSGSCS